MSYFLMEYNRESGVRRLQSFDDEAEALLELATREAARETAVEVILFMAQSEDDLRRTHSRFFMTAEGIGERLEDDFKRRAEKLAV